MKLNKSEMISFRLGPDEARQVKGFALYQALSVADLCRGAIFQVMNDVHGSTDFIDLPDALLTGGDDEHGL